MPVPPLRVPALLGVVLGTAAVMTGCTAAGSEVPGDPSPASADPSPSSAAATAAPAEHPEGWLVYAVPSDDYTGLPTDDPEWGSEIADSTVRVGWLDGGDQLAVVASGSGSCPPVATELRVDHDGRGMIVIEDRRPVGAGCTLDLSPHTTVIPVPPELDPEEPLEVAHLGVLGNVRLGAPPTDG
ncbi:hypothetical protein [Agromyces mangrovi Wang et al. 2018]|uniref:hypothetical protein n=1 Tax=Agromyces mangrovi TaxID=1858653 RepID=UPI002573B105|nr:hypothetical protein [Agromyces mangrovi]BDZ63956.1 hypothetical protein GCM10025877_08940 [Agromyces mangrovi]